MDCQIGDGLCGVPRATDSTMKMFASELTPMGNFFVGGTFESRVWSGEKFVDVQNVAVYQPRKNAWLPLQKDTVRIFFFNIAKSKMEPLSTLETVRKCCIYSFIAEYLRSPEYDCGE